jgi:hypothetical protein
MAEYVAYGDIWGDDEFAGMSLAVAEHRYFDRIFESL